MSRLAHSSRPEIQARRAAVAADPEKARRQQVYFSAKGENNKQIAQAWLTEWREGGFCSDFPELPDWLASKRAVGWQTHCEKMRALNALAIVRKAGVK